MKISHRGPVVLVGDVELGPGSARALASVIEGKFSEPGEILVHLRGRSLKIPKRSADAMVSALRRHASLAMVVRGPIGSGPLRDGEDAVGRLDELFGRLGDAMAKARP